MILQALVTYYEDLLKTGKTAKPGWGKAKISFGLNLSNDGKVMGLLPLKVSRNAGNKTVDAARLLEVPQPVKRASGIKANFLCDNSTYLMGVDEKGKPERSLQCFEECKNLHHRILGSVQTPASRAVLRYFELWNRKNLEEYSFLADHKEELMSGGNILFYVNGKSVLEDDGIRQAWQKYYDHSENGSVGICSVTGKETALVNLHPTIKGVVGAQAMGTSLVSFNAPAFCSYGKEQGANASIGEYAAFAYGTALNELLEDREHRRQIGDATVVYWVEGGEKIYQDITCAALFGTEDEGITDQDLSAIFSKLSKGEKIWIDEQILQVDRHFYVLGLAPNAARLAVRFFYMDSFGNMLKNIAAHYDRLKIVRPHNEIFENLPIWRLLSETVNKNTKDKSPSPQMAADMLQAVLTGREYPASLLNNTMLRIRAEKEVTYGRAAIIKAYYLKNKNKDCSKEKGVLEMELNENCTDVPYTLGRMFAVLEHIQQEANRGINATIKDKYFNAAASTPSHIFPVLINLAQKHLRKLNEGQKIYFDKQIGELAVIIGERYPVRMNLPEQGAFQLGYYCQTQKRYQKKEEK
ncbi:MAG: type I-C CRISPR-associated protein Cas8c/Csd1 [Lachnospiraceae bacterium]|jgi:CRISPR-associated protein Csd1|nr:type I-C CRISPR-associated protein Cas8c/Csd1 [Lachnospiraceae bacterium]